MLAPAGSGVQPAAATAMTSSSQPSPLTAWWTPHPLLCSNMSGHQLPSMHPAPQPGRAHVGLVFSLVFSLRNLHCLPCARPGTSTSGWSAFHTARASSSRKPTQMLPQKARAPATARQNSPSFCHCHYTQLFHITLSFRGCGGDGSVRGERRITISKLLNEA